MDNWINKIWYIWEYIEYYLALKKEILTHATAGMDLEDPMLSKISQSQKRQILYDSTYMSYQK